MTQSNLLEWWRRKASIKKHPKSNVMKTDEGL